MTWKLVGSARVPFDDELCHKLTRATPRTNKVPHRGRRLENAHHSVGVANMCNQGTMPGSDGFAEAEGTAKRTHRPNDLPAIRVNVAADRSVAQREKLPNIPLQRYRVRHK